MSCEQFPCLRDFNMEDYRENVVSSIIAFTKEDGNSSLQSLDNFSVIDYHELLGIQKVSALQEIIGHIHSCLNTATNRYDGLQLLEKLVHQCSTDVFTSNVETWFNLLIQILQSHADVCEKQLCCDVLCELVETGSNFPELTRELSSSVLPKLLPSLLEATSPWRERAAQCLAVCIGCYPGPCRAFRSKILAFITRELNDSSPRPSVIECFARTASLGGSASTSGRHVDGWTEQCQNLLNTLHQILTCLYEGLETESKTTKPNGIITNQDGCLFTFPPDTEPERSCVLISQFKTASFCLQALLRTKSSTAVRVPGFNIIKLVSRCLAVNYKMLLARPTPDRIRLFSRLPELHCISLDLLTSLVISCRTELLPLSDILNKLYMQMLVFTHMEHVYGNNTPLSQVREAVYRSLRQWLLIAGTSSNLITEERDFVKEILHDVPPVTDTLRLNESKKTGLDPPPSKKKKKGSYQELGSGMSSCRKIDARANSTVTVSALQVLAVYVRSFGDLLKQKSYQDIVDCVVSTVLEVQKTMLDAPVPYNNAECREALYRVLLACTTHSHPRVASLCHVSVRLFRAGLQDSSIEVSVSCQEALSTCECLIHPRAPCLQPPRLTSTSINVKSHAQTLEKLDQNANKNEKASENTISVNLGDRTNLQNGTETSVDQSDNIATSIPKSTNDLPDLTVEMCSSSSTSIAERNNSRPSTSGSIAMLSNESTRNGSSVIPEPNLNQSAVDDKERQNKEGRDDDEEELSSDEEMEETDKCEHVHEEMSKEGADTPQSAHAMEVQIGSELSTSNTDEVTTTSPEIKRSSDVDAMLLSFVDAGPDSD